MSFGSQAALQIQAFSITQQAKPCGISRLLEAHSRWGANAFCLRAGETHSYNLSR